MSTRTRFAPSPTGRLHLGHILAARVARALAEMKGGDFLLRHEDIDGPRVREEYYGFIEDDLRWLGLDWDGEPLRQTTRVTAYEEALETLRSRGLAYPCFCTRREIREEWERMGAAPQGSEQPVYPGICRNLSTGEQKSRLDSGMAYAWRLDSARAAANTGPLDFHDLRFGTIPVDAGLLGDVILARKDIGTAYHLAVVVDDAWQEISDVTRGEDLLNSTHVHRLLQHLLGFPQPVYLHHTLMLDENGQRLAKRCNSRSVESLREAGYTATEVLAMTAMRFRESKDLLLSPF